jgi:hypothetical protein
VAEINMNSDDRPEPPNYIPAERTDIVRTFKKHGWIPPSEAKKIVEEHERIRTLAQYIERKRIKT